MELETRHTILQEAKFEYEVRGKYLDLYDRINIETGNDVLRHLAQVPYEGDLEISVKNAVDKTYENMRTFEEMRVSLYDLHSKRETLDYYRLDLLSEPDYY